MEDTSSSDYMRFIVDIGMPPPQQYLMSEPHSEYHLVSYKPYLSGYQYVWERIRRIRLEDIE